MSATSSDVYDTNWNYVVGTYDDGDLTIFVNGVEKGSTGTFTESCTDNPSSHFYIGAHSDNTWVTVGTYDEVRVSSIVRSDDWIETSYNTIINATDGGFFTLGDGPISGEYELSVNNSNADNDFTWSGEAGDNVWANETGTGYQTGYVYTNLSGTSENCTAIYFDFSDFDSELYQENISICFINASDGSWGSVSSYTIIPSDDGNFTLNSSQWTSGVSSGWCHGTNPFSTGGITDYNSTIQFRLRVAIPSAASAGTYSESSDWYVKWYILS